MSIAVSTFADPPIGRTDADGIVIVFAVVVSDDIRTPRFLCARTVDGVITYVDANELVIDVLGEEAIGE